MIIENVKAHPCSCVEMGRDDSIFTSTFERCTFESEGGVDWSQWQGWKPLIANCRLTECDLTGLERVVIRGSELRDCILPDDWAQKWWVEHSHIGSLDYARNKEYGQSIRCQMPWPIEMTNEEILRNVWGA